MPDNDPQKIGVAAYGRRHAGPWTDGRHSCRLMILHVLAALFHQFVLKDGLVRRMLFGQRGPKSPVPAR